MTTKEAEVEEVTEEIVETEAAEAEVEATEVGAATEEEAEVRMEKIDLREDFTGAEDKLELKKMPCQLKMPLMSEGELQKKSVYFPIKKFLSLLSYMV